MKTINDLVTEVSVDLEECIRVLKEIDWNQKKDMIKCDIDGVHESLIRINEAIM
jgi:hypothetical protein